MTQDQTSGREPAPSFTPISATRADAPKQTEFRLVSPAPPGTAEEEDAGSAATVPTTPVPAVPSQARHSGADEDARGRGPDLADGEELMPGAYAGERSAHDEAGAAGPAYDGTDEGSDEELPPHGGNEDGTPRPPGADDQLPEDGGADDGAPAAYAGAGEELLPPSAGTAGPLASGADDEPLLSGLEELRAGWQRVRIAFVDNPRGAVAEAAGLTDEAAEALAAALREQRHRIRTSWDGNGSGRDTEALRLALLRYQALFSKIVGGLAHGARAR